MKKKVLLMGKSGAGKTSMKSIIFANYVARDTRRLGATIDVEHSNVRLMGKLILSLWDTAGQENFVKQYVTNQKDIMFKNVEVLIYVFDSESREYDKDLMYYEQVMENMVKLSKDAKVFCLLHKMDLIPLQERQLFVESKRTQIMARSMGMQPTLYPTSIWDESLYQAWSSIVNSLVPNLKQMEMELEKFCRICEASEVILFEKATFLVVSHTKLSCCQDADAHRFEKLSNIIKQFKLSCRSRCHLL
jgi:Ras-related GTP-binding protein A/B